MGPSSKQFIEELTHSCVVCYCICRFVSRFDALLARVRASKTPVTVAVVGGGAGGVELALAVNHRLQQERNGSLAKSTEGRKDVVK